MKRKKKVLTIIGVVLFIILAIAGILIYKAEDILLAYKNGEIFSKIYAEPKVAKFGEKVKVFYDSENNIEKPLFVLTYLTPTGSKIYCLEAKYDNKEERFFAEFDVPYQSYYLFIQIKGNNEEHPRSMMRIPCESNEGSAYHNYLLKLMGDVAGTSKAKEVYENDSLNYPMFYERYVEKWSWQEYATDTNKIAQDVKVLEKIKTDKDNVLSYVSHLVALMNGYCLLGDTTKFKEKLDEYDSEISKNRDYLEYFTHIRNHFFDNMVHMSDILGEEKSTKEDKKIAFTILKHTLEFATKYNIRSIITEYVKYINYADIHRFDRNFAIDITDKIISSYCDGLNSREYYGRYYADPENVFNLFRYVEKLNDKALLEKELALLNVVDAFMKPHEKTIISKDTNDYCTIFNGEDYDGAYFPRKHHRAKWLFANGKREQAIAILESAIENNPRKGSKKSGAYILEIIQEYYYEKKDLPNLERFVLELIKVDEISGKQQFNKKVIPLRKELKEKVLTFDEFKRLNSVYTPPTKSAPNVNITHSSGTVNPSKMGDVDLVFVSIDEQCQRCNDDIPGIIEALSKKKNVKLFFITDISKKGIYNAFDHEVDVIKKNEPNLKAIYYDRYKDDRIIIVRKNKLYIEATTLTGKELVSKYF